MQAMQLTYRALLIDLIISGVASYGALGQVHLSLPPRLPTISFLVHFRVNLTAIYPSIV